MNKRRGNRDRQKVGVINNLHVFKEVLAQVCSETVTTLLYHLKSVTTLTALSIAVFILHYYLPIATTLMLLIAIVLTLQLFGKEGNKTVQLWSLYFFCKNERGNEPTIQRLVEELNYSDMEGVLLWLLAHEEYWCWFDVFKEKLRAERASGFLRRSWLHEKVQLEWLRKEGGENQGVFVGLFLLVHSRLRLQYNGLPEREQLRELLLDLAQESDLIITGSAFYQPLISEQVVLMAYPYLKQVL